MSSETHYAPSFEHESPTAPRMIAWVVCGATALASLAHFLYYYPQLPERVISRFGLQGEPQGYMDKTSFLVFMLGLLLGLPLFLAVVSWLTRYLPNELINMPNKDYWLHPSRRESSLRRMEAYVLWISAATSALLMYCNHFAFHANLNPGAAAASFPLVSVGVYLAVILGIIIIMARNFRVPPEPAHS